MAPVRSFLNGTLATLAASHYSIAPSAPIAQLVELLTLNQ